MDQPLKLSDQLAYLSINNPFTKSDLNIRMEKACTVMDKIPIIWKPGLSDK